MVSLRIYGVPENVLPASLNNNNPYDNMRWEFAKKLIENESWRLEPAQDHYGYKVCGQSDDTYVARLEYARSKNALL